MTSDRDLDERAEGVLRAALSQRGEGFVPVPLDPASLEGKSRLRVASRVGLVAAVLGGVFAVVSLNNFGGDSNPASTSETAVPDVLGFPADDARETLEAIGFTVHLDHPRTCVDPPGYVTSQTPRPGAEVPQGSTVALTDPVMPSGLCSGWGGKEASQAAHQLVRFARGSSKTPPPGWRDCLATGLCSAAVLPLIRELGATLTYRNSMFCGPAPQMATVMAGPGDDCPRPFAYLTAHRDGVTSARISTEQPPTAAVPNTIGLSRDEARDLLDNAGFFVRDRAINLPSCDEPGVVLRQSPRPGSQIRVGGTVYVAANPRVDKNC